MISRTPAPGRSVQARWTAVVAGGVVVLNFEGTIVRSLDLDQWTILLLRGPLIAAGLALLFGLGRHSGGPLVGPRAAGRLGLAAAGLFAADNLLFIIALRSSSVANTLVLLETVLGPLWAWLLLGQAPAAATLGGGALIVAALLTHALLGMRRPPPAVAERPPV